MSKKANPTKKELDDAQMNKAIEESLNTLKSDAVAADAKMEEEKTKTADGE